MHVLVDAKIYGFQKHGGVRTYFHELMRRVAQRPGVTVEMLVPNPCLGHPPGAPVRWTRAAWLPVCDEPRSGVGRLLKRCYDSANRFRIDLKARLRRDCVFHSTLLTRITNAVPQVATAHDLNHELFPEKYSDDWGIHFRNRSRQCLTEATRVIAVSEKTRKDLVRFYGIDSSRVDVVHHAVDCGQFHPQREPSDRARFINAIGLDSPYILYVGGRTHHYKNFECVLRAFADSNLSRKYHLAVAGTGFTPDEFATIARLGLRDCVHLIQEPDIATLRLLYNFATAFVFPSFHEGFGLPLLEAMACGTMVVASDTEVFREVAGDASVYFDPQDPAALVAALDRCEDEAVRLDYVGRGFQRVKEFSWDRCAEQTYQVYCKALAH